jgi:putative DNA primase/helicase
MCGALDWRSHLWITGASGTGKSKVMKMFVKRLLGEMLVDAQGETTAPGIRQYLKSDALPVTFDEAESEDKRGADRMQDIVGLARSSSTSDSGKIFKGSAGGSANQYDLRSSFAMSSIGANLQHRSDVSRFTVLELKKDESETKAERWKKTQEIYAEIVTDEFVQSFISRNILLLPTILRNAKTFSNAASIVLDNQRTGDQLGTLLAGAYACASDNIISIDDAKAWIAKHDWNTEKLAEGTRDEIKVLNKGRD